MVMSLVAHINCNIASKITDWFVLKMLSSKTKHYTDDWSSGLLQTLKALANNSYKFSIISKEILEKIEDTNNVIVRAGNLSTSSLKTDDWSSGLVQTLKQFGNNDFTSFH